MLNKFIDLTGLEQFVGNYLTDTVVETDVKHAVSSKGVIDYVEGVSSSMESSVATQISQLQESLKGYLPLTGGTLTGAVIAPSFQTGTADTSYVQTKKMRGQGDASEYRHSVDWGYSGHDQVDFYEYGATWNFYQCLSQEKTRAKLVGSILSTGWNGGAVLSGTPTAPTASKGTNTTQIATTAFVQTAIGDKVSIVSGKDLSTNDFSDDYKLQVDSNTSARHSHSNKDLLDGITEYLKSASVANGVITLKDNSDNEIVFSSTDTKVTSVENHYVPVQADTFTVTAQSDTSASWNDTSIVTGVSIGKDDAGHITSLSVDSIKFPSLPTKTDIGLGNVENTALSTWKGSANLSTVGTITSGIWNGDALTSDYIGNHTHTSVDITDLDTTLSSKADKATTLSGYGITDAKIENGKITLGSTTIIPLTSHQDISGKVDKVDGKGLSTNDFSDDYKSQVDSNTSARHSHSNKALLDNISEYIKSASVENGVITLKDNSNKSITFSSTDSKVTSVENHYTPVQSDSFDVDASSDETATWGSTSVVTGVTLGKDDAGHITSVSVDSINLPSNPDTWRDIQVDSKSIDKNTLNLKATGSSTISNSNGVVTIASTDSKVTSVENHYTPAQSDSFDVTAQAGTEATWGSTSFITGLSLGKDNAGHITNVTIDSAKLPSNPDTWRDIKVNNTSINKNTLNLVPGNNVTLDNSNGTVTINSSYSNTEYTFTTGTDNGTFIVTPSNGNAQPVSIKGLKGLAYKDSLSYSDVNALPETTTYVKKITKDGDTLTITPSSGTEFTFTGANPSVVTTTTDGLMSSTDKVRLDGMEDGAEANIIETVKVNGTAQTVTDKAVDITVPTAVTDLSDGSSYAKKATTLSGYGITDAKIESGKITLGSNSITPLTSHQDISGKADKATTLAGYGITDAKISNGVITLGTNTITPLTSHQDISGKEDSSNKVTSWSATTSDTKYPSEKLVKDSLDDKANSSHTHTVSQISDFPTLAKVATSGSYSDLSNKPSIPSVDSTLSSTSTNAIQNKAVYSALSGKANSSHTHAISDVTSLQTTLDSKASRATTLSGYGITDTYTKTEIDNKLSSSMKYMGQKDTEADLPNSGNNTGDVWDVASNGHNYAWNGTSWDDLGGTVDLSSYYTSTQVDTKLSGKANSSHTHAVSQISDFPTLAKVATSGSYSDLSNKPAIPSVDSTLISTSTNAIQNKAVYDALNGKANSSHTHTVSQISDFPTLSKVATSGSYSDLSNKPSIPSVDSTLSSTSTNAIQNKAVYSALSGKASSSHTHTVSQISDFPTLSKVATSGSYSDLSGTPSIATTSANGLMSSTDKSNLDTIKGSYIKSATKSGQTLTLTNQDGTAVSLTNTDTNTNTWRNIKVNSASTDSLGTGTGTGALNFLSGTNTTASYDTTNKGIKYNVAVTNKGATLSYGGTSTVATIGSTDVTVKMPAQYSHPTYTTASSGLYKITVDGTGHVSGAIAVTKADITALGIPSSDTNTQREIKVGGTSKIGSDSSTALDFIAGNNVSLSYDSGKLTISAEDTTYQQGNGITISGNIIGHSNSAITAGTVKGTNGSVKHGGTISIPSISYDTYGHITGSSTTTVTLPADNNTTYTFDTGTTNGAFSVTPSGGTVKSVSIYGLGSLAYKSSLTASDIPTIAPSKVSGLAKVATSGSYSDLSNQPSIPTIATSYSTTGTSAFTAKALATADAVSALLNCLSTGSATPTGNDYYIAQYAGGGTTTTSYHRRPVSALYSYMKSKMDSVYSPKAGSSSITTIGTLSSGTVPVDRISGLGTLATKNSLSASDVGALSSSTPYVKSASVSDSTLTLTPSSGDAVTFTNTVTDIASTTGNGNAVTAISASGGQLTVTKGATFLTSHQSVTNKSATLSWGTSSTIATIGSTSITVSLPSNPNTDTNYYPTKFAWANGNSSGPTGSLTVSGTSAVPFSAIPSASDSISGVVTTGTQTFAGAKTFNNPISVATSGTALTVGTSSGKETLALIQATSGYWAYTRLTSGSYTWDTAVNSGNNTGSYQIRYQGGDTDAFMFRSKGGNGTADFTYKTDSIANLGSSSLRFNNTYSNKYYVNGNNAYITYNSTSKAIEFNFT